MISFRNATITTSHGTINPIAVSLDFHPNVYATFTAGGWVRRFVDTDPPIYAALRDEMWPLHHHY